jgi:hypothetical protein
MVRIEVGSGNVANSPSVFLDVSLSGCLGDVCHYKSVDCRPNSAVVRHSTSRVRNDDCRVHNVLGVLQIWTQLVIPEFSEGTNRRPFKEATHED